jgi:thymidylate synthase
MYDMTDIRELFIGEFYKNNFVTDKSGVKLLELVGINFLADEDNIFGQVNVDYVQRELQWYLSQSLNVNDIPGEVPKIWKEVATPKGLINSNYGYLVFSPENGSQYNNVLNELVNKPTSRRAVMIYTRPTMWSDYNKDGMSDFICTNSVQYFIRNNRLDVFVSMRSNDVVFGYRNDYAWQKFVRDRLIEDINHDSDMNLKPGKIMWSVGSLHVYERDFWRVECWHMFGENFTKSEFEQKKNAISSLNYGK